MLTKLPIVRLLVIPAMVIGLIGLSTLAPGSPEGITDNIIDTSDFEITFEDFDSDPDLASLSVGLHPDILCSALLAPSLTAVRFSSCSSKTSPIRAPPRIALA